MALCFTQRSYKGEKIHAVGRYYFLEHNNTAEVAFVIGESKRGQGIATTLLAGQLKGGGLEVKGRLWIFAWIHIVRHHHLKTGHQFNT